MSQAQQRQAQQRQALQATCFRNGRAAELVHVLGPKLPLQSRLIAVQVFRLQGEGS